MGESAGRVTLDRRSVMSAGAAEVFARHGFHGASMAQIAGASGITGPALYRHFSGKYAVLAAVLDRATEIVEDVIAQAGACGRPDDVVQRTIAGMARCAVEHPAFGAVLIRDTRHLSDDDRFRHIERWDRIMNEIAHRVRAVRPGLTGWEAELIARMMTALAGSPSSGRVRGLKDASRRRQIERMLTRLTAMDLAGGDPPPSVPEPVVEAAVRTARREAIITAANRLFRARGFHDVSMEDIALSAGVTGPTLYGYFESKADLLGVAQQRGAAWLALCLDQALRSGTTPADRLRRVLMSYVDFALRHGDTFAVLARESCNLSEDARRAVERDHGDYLTEVAGLVRAMRTDLDEPGARAAVGGCLDAVTVLATSWRYQGWPGLGDRLTAMTTGLLVDATW